MSPEEKRERNRIAKRKYYASAKGKASRARELIAARDSGAAARRDARRQAKGITEARLASRALHGKRIKPLTDFDRWVFAEAKHLAQLRTALLGRVWEIDHITPVSRGGTSDGTNLQVVPQVWNKLKHNRHAERFLGAN